MINKKFTAIAALLSVAMLITACSAGTNDTETAQSQATTAETQASEVVAAEGDYSKMTAEEIVASLSLEEKVYQMMQGAVYSIDAAKMQENCYGSVLSTFGEDEMTASAWRELMLSYQQAALNSETGIPFIYGQDDVHGVNYCKGAVIFPHNINLGAANDPELTYEMGLAVADEAKLTGMLWNFAPCVAASQDPRWGRTYESFSSDIEIVKSLSVVYAKGIIDGGILPCAKHFFGDGNVVYGTGEKSDVARIIDRGDATLTDEEIDELLSVYQELVDAGVKSVMISHSSVNGVKMHENEKYISMLKNDMGFDGFIISDWNSIENISGDNLREKVTKSVNAGIDMLMQVENYDECAGYIVDGVNDGSISQERVDDAATRIIRVKKEMGLFDDPMMENLETKQTEVGSEQYRQLAQTIAEESLVLLKNDGGTLPIQQGSKIFITGPAANDVGVQCGGWTVIWGGMTDKENGGKHTVDGATSILDGFNEIAEEYNLTIITDEAEAADADLTILCIGEQPYAEWDGDAVDLSVTGELGLVGNEAAIALAESLGKPTVACIVAGRNVIISEYEDKWDSIVMCYLPGSEGGAVSNVLMGKKSITGKLPMPYYAGTEDIEAKNPYYNVGYGLEY